MSLHRQFKDESEFRENLVKPLLNRLGFYGVSEHHGTQEFGKDFVFSELHRLGGMRHYAAQVKHEEKIHQGKLVDELLSQVRQAFAKPFKRADSPRECYVSAVYIFNSGEITPNAKEQLLTGLEREHYGDNVHFLDGERLAARGESRGRERVKAGIFSGKMSSLSEERLRWRWEGRRRRAKVSFGWRRSVWPRGRVIPFIGA